MKIAVQISGEFRYLSACWQSFERYILKGFPRSDVDVFLHTWRCDTPTDSLSDHGKGLALFQPRGYLLESYADRQDLQNLPRAYSMFYSIQQANEQRKNYERLLEISYDLVIRYRTDLQIQEPLYPKIQKEIQSRKPFLWIPKSTCVSVSDGPVEDSICDWFAIGTPDAMDVYCGTFATWLPVALPIVPESMLAMQLKSRGIQEETNLKRYELAVYLERGQTAAKQSLKSPEGSEER